MEWDDARLAGFEPLRFVPNVEAVAHGLVSTRRGELEDRDLLRRRIAEASRYVDRDRLCLSTVRVSSTVEGTC
jgi:5-methyltetrahydropteroyltriglutamate--homocysteine methyltransferase